MKPGSLWIGLVLVAVGVCGILDVAGIIDTSRTIGEWWPLAVIAWPVIEMLAARHVSGGWLIVLAVGAAFLAGEQEWVSDAFLWSAFAVVVGLVILAEASLAASRSTAVDGSTTQQSTSWWDTCWGYCSPSSDDRRQSRADEPGSGPERADPTKQGRTS